MDPLSDVLSLLEPRAHVTGALRAGAPWSLALPAYQGVKCYMVVQGTCWLDIEGEAQPVQLREGNCVLLPHGRPFVIASDLNLAPVDAREVVSSVSRYNGVLSITPGDDVFLVGTHFELGEDARFLLDVLPLAAIVEDDAPTRWAVDRILREMQSPRPGGTLLAQQLASIVLVDALRSHLQDGQQPGSNWLSALSEPHMRKALSAIHEAPAKDWSLAQLADTAGMSRTAFAQTFKRMVGEPPMTYLTRWRMTLAARRLRAGREPISAIATAVGYQSDSAFCAAFRRQRGCSPRQYEHARHPGD